jgi:hypothetical protein
MLSFIVTAQVAAFIWKFCSYKMIALEVDFVLAALQRVLNESRLIELDAQTVTIFALKSDVTINSMLLNLTQMPFIAILVGFCMRCLSKVT